MRRHHVRLSRLVAGAVVTAAAAPWLGIAVANADAPKSAPPSGDARATSYVGNVTTCAQLGLGTATQIDDGNVATSGWDVTVDAAKQNVTVASAPAGQQVDAFVVKGGDGYNLYAGDQFTSLPVTGLHAPLVGSPPTTVPLISHWFLCAGPISQTPPPVVVSPTASGTATCAATALTLAAGSAATDFVLTRAGDASGQTTSVPANGSVDVSVPLDAAHPSVAVTAGSSALGSFARPSGCDATSTGSGSNGSGSNGSGSTGVGSGTTTPVTGTSGGSQSGGSQSGSSQSGGTQSGGTVDLGGASTAGAAPTVSFSAACATGIAVVLGDLDGSAPVTFSVVAPNGSHDSVPVRVGQLVKRTYAVTEGTTGTVSVTAPGLARKAFSYTKRCTRVLGEKVVKGTRTVRATQGSGSPAAVRGQQAQLPFTGFPAGRALLLGALLTAAGVALTLAPRRRYAGRHAA